MSTFRVVDEVPVAVGRARVYEEGWQSWSPTTWYRVDETSRRPRLDWQHLMRFRAGVELPERGFQGSGLLVVDPGTGEPVRVYAADFSPDHVPSIRAELVDGRLVVSADDAGASGAEVTVLLAPDPTAGLAAFGGRYAAGAGAVLRPAPTVWCSWYRYFLEVTEADVLENLESISAWELPVDVVQVDDGWQSGIGDWTTLSGRFTSLPALVDRIRGAGRRAGIWVAPFIAGSASELARDHPGWLVGDAGSNWDQEVRGVDLTHPGAREYLWGALRGLRDAGFDYFKLDFLYGGTAPGPRHDPDVTAVAAYRSGLELVRDAVGPDAYLVGCGAPILPSVGLVDAMRVSPDTFHVDAQDGSRGLRGEMATTARAWQHGRLWVNDPDCLVARPTYALRERWAGVVERYGGLRSCSDRVVELDDWGLETTRRLLSTAPPPLPFPHTVPTPPDQER